MNPSEVLGKPESLQLEFKGAAALDHPERIAREVVAMLNANGGAVWIGFEEEESHATRATGVVEAARQVGRLNDTFMNRIEPPPAPADVTPRLVKGEGVEFICVEVAPKPSAHGYCYLDGNRREFLIRIGTHIRNMSREEIVKAIGSETSEPQEQVGPRRATKLIERGEPKWSLIFEVEPEAEINADSVDLAFRDPRQTGVRSDGWIIPSPYSEIRHRFDSIEVKKSDWSTSIDPANGWIDFTADLSSVEREPQTVWPYALVEYISSAVRLGVHFHAGETASLAHLTVTFVGIGGWSLRPYSPKSLAYEMGERRTLPESNQAITRSFTFDMNALQKHPDSAAYRILWWIYDSFGHAEKAIPFFDPETKHLRLE